MASSATKLFLDVGQRRGILSSRNPGQPRPLYLPIKRHLEFDVFTLQERVRQDQQFLPYEIADLSTLNVEVFDRQREVMIASETLIAVTDFTAGDVAVSLEVTGSGSANAVWKIAITGEPQSGSFGMVKADGLRSDTLEFGRFTAAELKDTIETEMEYASASGDGVVVDEGEQGVYYVEFTGDNALTAISLPTLSKYVVSNEGFSFALEIDETGLGDYILANSSGTGFIEVAMDLTGVTSGADKVPLARLTGFLYEDVSSVTQFV